jgi:ubiquinone biosynthesis protein
MFGKRMRHINRYRDIAAALINQGFEYVVEEMGLTSASPLTAVTDKTTRGIGERIRLVLQQLGPTYIKLGQIASTRPDLLPNEVICELEKLQDNVPSFSFTQVRNIIEQELGATLEELYQQFNSSPLAAASIGQVHQAILKTGEKVAVKIQRPGISAMIETDLEILHELASLAERRFTWAENYQIADMVNEFSKSLRDELDYTIEAHNAEKIAKQFTDNPKVYIPRVYWDYSTKKILTAEYIEGLKISEVEKLEQQGYNLHLVAERLVKAIFHQIFLAGFFHGDPHPGNIVVLPGEIIGFLDFGMVGQLSAEMKYNLASLIIALMRQSSSDLVKAILHIGIVPDNVNMRQLRNDIEIVKKAYLGMPLSQISLGDAVSNIFAIALKHKIKMPADLTLLGKALLTIEGTVERLDPDLSILDIAEPFGRKLLMERLQPQALVETVWKSATEFGNLLVNLPKHFEDLSFFVKRGRLRLDVSIPEINFFLKAQDRISNRLPFSIILLAFSIIMSSIIVGLSLAGQASFLLIPAVEIGFGIAMLMFLWLLYTIIRSDRW